MAHMTQTEAAEFSATDLERIEYALKQRMAQRFGALQANRAFQDESQNVGSAKSYVQEARALRKVLQVAGKQRYVPLRRFHSGQDWISDERLARADEVDPAASGTAELHDLVAAIHAVGYVPATERRTLTDHPSVPGASA